MQTNIALDKKGTQLSTEVIADHSPDITVDLCDYVFCFPSPLFSDEYLQDSKRNFIIYHKVELELRRKLMLF